MAKVVCFIICDLPQCEALKKEKGVLGVVSKMAWGKDWEGGKGINEERVQPALLF